MQPQRRYRSAAIQFDPRLGAKDWNVAQLSRLVREAAERGAKLVVLPEMATTGIFFASREEVAPLAETVPGPTTDLFVDLARELDCLILVGLPEIEPSTKLYYNAAVLVGPEGVLGHHRKVHAYATDPLWASTGDLGFPVVATPLGRIGISICMDANYPETARSLALAGAEVLALPVSWTAEVCPAPLWITRAFENGLPEVCANREGVEREYRLTGGSCVIDPDGSIQALVDDGEGIAVGTIDLDDPRSRSLAGTGRSGLELRRPELYGALGLHRYLFGPEESTAFRGVPSQPTRAESRILALELPGPIGAPALTARLDAVLADSGPTDLLVLPEFAFVGRPADSSAARGLAEPLDGPCVVTLTRFAAAHGLHVVAGIVEVDATGDLYDTLVVVGPGGLLTSYRASHLAAQERTWAVPGDSLVVVDLPSLRIGLLTGTDLLIPEPCRTLALLGADVVCVLDAGSLPPAVGRPPTRVAIAPEHRPAEEDPRHWYLPRVRAGESNVVVAVARLDRTPDDQRSTSPARAGIHGPVTFQYPWDDDWPETGSDGIGIARRTVSAAEPALVRDVLRDKPVLARRLPGYYGALMARAPT